MRHFKKPYIGNTKTLRASLRHFTDYEKNMMCLKEKEVIEVELFTREDMKQELESKGIHTDKPVRIIFDYDPDYNIALVRVKQRDYTVNPGDGIYSQEKAND